ncbi:MAG: GtrA family protein [Candidatus Pacebacteria bacterium]|nr:GtrA family protein [Candidatus Paceibacterota bacterium]
MNSRQSTIARYLISGSIASAVMFIALVVFREFFGLWYLTASTFAFVLSFVTSFVMQKFWTFEDASRARATGQLISFFIISLANLGLNAAWMFILVDMIGLWYLGAQVIVTASIAVWSFFAYRRIFARRDDRRA